MTADHDLMLEGIVYKRIWPRVRKSIKTARAEATKRPPLGRIGPAPKSAAERPADPRDGLGSRLSEACSHTESPGRFGSTSGVAAHRKPPSLGAQIVVTRGARQPHELDRKSTPIATGLG